MAETQEQNDGELLAEFACRANEAAFGALVERHSPMVHSVCLRVLGDFHEAQDVTQAVFLTLARKAVSLRKDPSIGGWLHRVALCLARDVRSSRQRRRLREERTAMDRETTTVETSEADRHALRAELDEAFDQLPERYRQALVLFHLEERSLEQTAGALGLKLSAASARLVRGREMLRKKLVRRGVTVGSVGVLTALLSTEAGAAVLPATFVSATVKAASLAATGKLASGVGAGVVSAKVAALTKGALQTLLMTQLKTAAIIGIACTVVTTTGALATRALLTPASPATSVEQEIEKPASTTIVSQGARSDAGATHAQRIRIANETLIPRDERTMTVRFDISWNNSWRHEVNHDAAWVFFKVRPEGAKEWQHVRLAADRVLNPTGYGQKEGNLPAEPVAAQAAPPLEFLVPAGVDGFTGMLVRRAGHGVGDLTASNVTAVWNVSASTGIAKGAAVAIKGFGIHMTYVAEGAFFLGSGGTETGGFYQYTDGRQNNRPYRVTGAGAIPTGQKDGRLWARGAAPEDGGTIPASFPNGYAAFYLSDMPTHEEYANFLSMLPESGEKTRGPDKAWQVSTGPELSWAEGARWTAWAGLRPMTELEYEKAMRGFREPVPYEAGQSFWGYLAGKRVASVARVVSVADAVGRNFAGTHGLGTTILPTDWPQADAVGTGIRGGRPDTEPARLYTSDRMRAALADDKRDPNCAWRGVRTAP